MESYVFPPWQTFFRPANNYRTDAPGGHGMDSIMLGHISQQASTLDAKFTRQLTNFLFSPNPPFNLGTDLPSLNTQRGRDHGLPCEYASGNVVLQVICT